MSHCSGCSPLLEMKSCENLLVQARWTFYYIILINWRNLFVKKIFLLDSLLKLNVYCLYNYQQFFNFHKTLFTHRLYWDKQVDDCIVRQTNTHFQYGYEYLGNSGRLVITPLTDRFFPFVIILL